MGLAKPRRGRPGKRRSGKLAKRRSARPDKNRNSGQSETLRSGRVLQRQGRKQRRRGLRQRENASLKKLKCSAAWQKKRPKLLLPKTFLPWVGQSAHHAVHRAVHGESQQRMLKLTT